MNPGVYIYRDTYNRPSIIAFNIIKSLYLFVMFVEYELHVNLLKMEEIIKILLYVDYIFLPTPLPIFDTLSSTLHNWKEFIKISIECGYVQLKRSAYLRENYGH